MYTAAISNRLIFQKPRRPLLPATMMPGGQPPKILPPRSSDGSAPPEPRSQDLLTRTWPDFDPPFFFRNIRVEEKMIKDHVQTDTYKAAIWQYQDSIAGKVVLDVGCGVGLLSIFCACVGARRVYAVEASGIAIKANEIVKANNLSDKVIVLHGPVESVQIAEKVDVIISEWMGYMLLYESMLPSIIFARNTWLKPGGLILPSHAMLLMAPFTHSARYHESIDFWKNVNGIMMSPMLPLAKQCAFGEPCIETISRRNLLAWPKLVKEVDCYTVTVKELEFVHEQFKFMSMLKAPLHGFVFWFMVKFQRPKFPILTIPLSPPSNSHEKYIVLSTGPRDPPTHWKQTLVYLYDPIELEETEVIQGLVTLTQRKANPPRSLSIRISCRVGEQTFVRETVLRGLT